MRTCLLVAAAGVSLALSAGAACAADATPNDQSLVMNKIDPDHDGTISKAEAKTAADAKFDALDTDKEGTLDASELTGVVGPKGMAKADPDKDKTLDKAEYEAHVMSLFDKADTDHDGTLSAKELSTAEGRAVVATLDY